MVAKYMTRLFVRNRDFILREVLEVKGLMQLLMKHRNTGEKWTKDELRQIRGHFRELSKMVPVLIVFLLPGGSLFLPFLAQVLDRRTKPR